MNTRTIFIKISLTIIPLILALLSYIASKFFVVSRYGTVAAYMEKEGSSITFFFLMIVFLIAVSDSKQRKKMAIVYISLYIISLSAYFYDLFYFGLKIISIVLIAGLSLLIGTLQVKEERES
ncbi:MAG: hypothetical protein O8C66_13270 [Candidatus Methanoperedens sp.]|nr:hypothetical protein [Candidatus Methanoperedens sp.]MCZ7371468.1 hypothetical protein [Candidatus Methanoperedens sp.]